MSLIESLGITHAADSSIPPNPWSIKLESWFFSPWLSTMRSKTESPSLVFVSEWQLIID
jgi:hypothetical protein